MLFVIMVLDGRMLRTSRKSREYLATTIRVLLFTAFLIFCLQKYNTNLHRNEPALILEVNFKYLEVW